MEQGGVWFFFICLFFVSFPGLRQNLSALRQRPYSQASNHLWLSFPHCRVHRRWKRLP